MPAPATYQARALCVGLTLWRRGWLGWARSRPSEIGIGDCFSRFVDLSGGKVAAYNCYRIRVQVVIMSNHTPVSQTVRQIFACIIITDGKPESNIYDCIFRIPADLSPPSPCAPAGAKVRAQQKTSVNTTSRSAPSRVMAA